jgi:hypothetical protein
MDKMLVADLIENIEPYLTPDEFLVALATKAAEWEREQCAKLCDAADKSTHPADLADAIRARGEK